MLTKEQINSIKKIVSEDDDRMPIVLSALGDINRYKILKILINHHEICVTDIASILGITVSAASQQLRVLERIGLIKRERMKQKICYEVRNDDSFVKRLSKLIF